MGILGCIYIYIYRGYIGIMEQKMETTIQGLCRGSIDENHFA